MKIHRFLISIQDILLNTPDISIKTIRKIMNSFELCLSITEINNDTTKLLLRVIREVGLKQISIKAMNNKIIVSNLEKELNIVKEIENDEKELKYL